jgi:hypothetical protein
MEVDMGVFSCHPLVLTSPDLAYTIFELRARDLVIACPAMASVVLGICKQELQRREIASDAVGDRSEESRGGDVGAFMLDVARAVLAPMIKVVKLEYSEGYERLSTLIERIEELIKRLHDLHVSQSKSKSC